MATPASASSSKVGIATCVAVTTGAQAALASSMRTSASWPSPMSRSSSALRTGSPRRAAVVAPVRKAVRRDRNGSTSRTWPTRASSTAHGTAVSSATEMARGPRPPVAVRSRSALQSSASAVSITGSTDTRSAATCQMTASTVVVSHESRQMSPCSGRSLLESSTTGTGTERPVVGSTTMRSSAASPSRSWQRGQARTWSRTSAAWSACRRPSASAARLRSVGWGPGITPPPDQ